MSNIKLFYFEPFKPSDVNPQIICGAENDTFLNEVLKIEKKGKVSLYQVIEIEAYRKKINELPKGYSGLITLKLIEGPSVNFEFGDSFSSFSE
jgi:hypothetical protein